MIKRLTVNTFSNLGTLLLKLSITFLMTPILLKNMGRYDYGVWEQIGAVLGYMGMLDLGIRPAVSRFASRYVAQKDQNALQTLYATSWFFLSVVGLLIASILVIWGVFFPQLIAEHSQDTQRYTILMLILAIEVIITFPSYAAESYMESYQEYYLKNNITIVNSIIGTALIYSLIRPSNALVLLAAINTAGVSIKYIFLVWYMHFKRPFLKMKWQYFSYSQLKELLSFSVKTLIQGIATRIENATDSLVIGGTLGAATVPLFTVPANLLNYVRTIANTGTHVFMPYFSGLSAEKNDEKIREVYIAISKIIIALTLILSIGAVIMGESFLRLWVGSEIADSAKDLILLITLFTILPLLNPLSSRYLTAIDKHIFLAKWQPIVAVANLCLSLILVRYIGLVGVVWGSLIPALIFNPIVLVHCCRHLQISVMEYLKGSILPLAIPSVAMGFTLVFLKNTLHVNGYFVLLTIASCGTGIFLLLAYFFGLNSSEKSQLLSIVGKYRKS